MERHFIQQEEAGLPAMYPLLLNIASFRNCPAASMLQSVLLNQTTLPFVNNLLRRYKNAGPEDGHNGYLAGPDSRNSIQRPDILHNRRF